MTFEPSSQLSHRWLGWRILLEKRDIKWNGWQILCYQQSLYFVCYSLNFCVASQELMASLLKAISVIYERRSGKNTSFEGFFAWLFFSLPSDKLLKCIHSEWRYWETASAEHYHNLCSYGLSNVNALMEDDLFIIKHWIIRQNRHQRLGNHSTVIQNSSQQTHAHMHLTCTLTFCTLNSLFRWWEMR